MHPLIEIGLLTDLPKFRGADRPPALLFPTAMKARVTRHFFSPGMHFSQAVASIQSMVGSVKGVQILYSDKVMHL